MAPINTALGQVKEGRLGALGVSTRTRASVMPEVPALAEQGLQGFDISLWFGVWAKAGTPPAVVQKLNAQVNAIVQGPEVKEQFAKLGILPSPMKPEEFARFVREQITTYRGIVKEAGIPQQ
jgi:tripartite-type tricarboxylate transporter receptor subunit TctC